MNELPPAHEKDDHSHEAPAAEKPASTLPTSVMVLGFIAITLVGVLIASAIRSKPAAEAKEPGDDTALREAKARIQMLQNSVNEERAKLGLSPMYGQDTRGRPAEAKAACCAK